MHVCMYTCVYVHMCVECMHLCALCEDVCMCGVMHMRWCVCMGMDAYVPFVCMYACVQCV